MSLGMPECKFGLNDKLIMEKEGGAAAAATAQNKGHGVRDIVCIVRIVRIGCRCRQRRYDIVSKTVIEP